MSALFILQDNVGNNGIGRSVEKKLDQILPAMERISNHRIKDAAIHSDTGAARKTLAHLATLLNASRVDADPMRYMVHPTNQDIADAIFLSPRRVEEHLAQLEAGRFIRRIYRPDTNWRLAIDLTPLVLQVEAIEQKLKARRAAQKLHRQQGQLELHLDKLDGQIDQTAFEKPATAPVSRMKQELPEAAPGKDTPPRKSAGGGADSRAHISTLNQKIETDAQNCAETAFELVNSIFSSNGSTRTEWTRTCGTMEARLNNLVHQLFGHSGRATSLTWAHAIRIFGLPKAAQMLAVAIADPGRRKTEERYLGGLVAAGRLDPNKLQGMLDTGLQRIRRAQVRAHTPKIKEAPLLEAAGEPEAAVLWRKAILEEVGAGTYRAWFEQLKFSDFDGRLAATGTPVMIDWIRDKYQGHLDLIGRKLKTQVPMLMMWAHGHGNHR